jgi:hypothetical protein
MPQSKTEYTGRGQNPGKVECRYRKLGEAYTYSCPYYNTHFAGIGSRVLGKTDCLCVDLMNSDRPATSISHLWPYASGTIGGWK